MRSWKEKFRQPVIIMVHSAVVDFALVEPNMSELNQLDQAVVKKDLNPVVSIIPGFGDFEHYGNILFQEEFSNRLKPYWEENLKNRPCQITLPLGSAPGEGEDHRVSTKNLDVPQAVTQLVTSPIFCRFALC